VGEVDGAGVQVLEFQEGRPDRKHRISADLERQRHEGLGGDQSLALDLDLRKQGLQPRGIDFAGPVVRS